MAVFLRVLLMGFGFLSALNARQGSPGFERICNSPEIYVCEHFLSDGECEHLIELARPQLSRTTVADEKSAQSVVDPRRTAWGVFLSPVSDDKVVQKMHKRIAKITGIPIENGEGMQVLHYGEGAEYQPHYDFFNPNTPGGKLHYNRGGQRIATFMVYLNTPEAGGETVFPRAGLQIKAEKGKAVLFYNVTESGNEDFMSFHGGAPVIQGEKWLITRWLRQNAFY